MKNSQNKGRVGAVVTGAVVGGALVAAAIKLSDKKTRDNLKNKAIGLKTKAQKMLNGKKEEEMVEDTRTKWEAKLDELKAKVKGASADAKLKLNQEIKALQDKLKSA